MLRPSLSRALRRRSRPGLLAVVVTTALLGSAGCEASVKANVRCAIGGRDATITVKATPDEVGDDRRVAATYRFENLLLGFEWGIKDAAVTFTLQGPIARTATVTTDLPTVATRANVDLAGTFGTVTVATTGDRMPTSITIEASAADLAAGSTVDWFVPTSYSTKVQSNGDSLYTCRAADPDQVVIRQPVKPLSR